MRHQILRRFSFLLVNIQHCHSYKKSGLNQRFSNMKAAFFFSFSQAQMFDRQPIRVINTIDGQRFTEEVVLSDDEVPQPANMWNDNVLVVVIENVPMKTIHGVETVDTYKLLSTGRIKHSTL